MISGVRPKAGRSDEAVRSFHKGVPVPGEDAGHLRLVTHFLRFLGLRVCYLNEYPNRRLYRPDVQQRAGVRGHHGCLLRQRRGRDDRPARLAETFRRPTAAQVELRVRSSHERS